MHSTFSQKTYVDTATIYYLHPYSTVILQEKPQQQAELGFKWELPTWANSGHIGMVGKISILIRRPCEQRRGWWSGDVVAGQLPPTGNQLLVSGIGTRRSPVASLLRLQLPVKHKRSRQQASISRMTIAPHAQQCNRQPTHWEWRAFPPQAPANSFLIICELPTGMKPICSFFFYYSGSVTGCGK